MKLMTKAIEKAAQAQYPPKVRALQLWHLLQRIEGAAGLAIAVEHPEAMRVAT